jgi:hypothetical protein
MKVFLCLQKWALEDSNELISRKIPQNMYLGKELLPLGVHARLILWAASKVV